MTLEDLEVMGTVEVSGVSFGQDPENRWGDAPSTMTIVIDERAFTFVEDPDDGYRSYLGEIRDGGECTNKFPPVECDLAWSDGERDVLVFTVKKTGKVLVEVGTDHSDNYYPWVVQKFDPTAMA